MEVTHVGGGLVMARADAVCIAIWGSKPLRATFDRQRAELSTVVRAHPRRALFLCVVEESADPPDDDVRSASSKMINEHGDALVACACIVEGSGFRAAITRTVLTGMTLITRPVVPFTFLGRVDAAVAWFARRAPRDQLQDLALDVETARARMQR